MIIDINKIPIQITINKNENRKEKFLYWLKICKEKNSLEQISNIGGIQTAKFPFYMIKDAFKKDIDQYLNCFKRKIDFKWKISSAWVNENNYADFNMPHNHSGLDVQFCGIWYIKCPKDSGNLVFLNRPSNDDPTRLGDFFDDPISWAQFNIVPQDYLLVLFPSTLVHLVKPSRSNENRISFSFNISLIKG